METPSSWSCARSYLLVATVVLGAGCGSEARKRAVTEATDGAPPVAVATPSTTNSVVMARNFAKTIDGGEYRIEATGLGLSAPNRANDLRTTWAPSGVWLEARKKSVAGSIDHGLAVNIATISISRGQNATPFGAPRFVTGACRHDGAMDEDGKCLRRVEAHYALGITEWWENRADGIEQGFDIERRPPRAGAADAALVLRLRIDGARVELGDLESATLITTDGRKLDYGRLSVTDSKGAKVPAELVPTAEGLGIAVHDAGASYPIHVDPVLTQTWVRDDSDNTSSGYGGALVAGDFNSDGFSDVVVSAPGYDTGNVDAGKIFIYLGSASGLSATPVAGGPGSGPNVASARFGAALAALKADANGSDDLAVSAPGLGKVFVYFSSAPTGCASWALSSTPWSYTTSPLTTSFGNSIGKADVNHDGVDDLVVGDSSVAPGGKASIYFGPFTAGGSPTAAGWSVASTQSGFQYGSWVSGAGDVNGDGVEDVVVGATMYTEGSLVHEGAMYLYAGVSGGTPSMTPAVVRTSGQTNAGMWQIASAGDVNGDGLSDVVAASPFYSNGQASEGTAFLYLGKSDGTFLGQASPWTPETNQASANLDFATGAGDVNGDGLADVVAGSPYYNSGLGTGQGKVWLYLGTPTGLSSTPAWSAVGETATSLLSVVASAGDVNGDSLGDVVTGGFNASGNVANEGRAYVYQSDTSHLQNLIPFFRLYCPPPTLASGFYYTESVSEKNSTIAQYPCWSFDRALGYVSSVQTGNAFPLYRLRTPSQSYFLTPLASERDNVVAQYGFVYERVVGYSFASQLNDTWGLHRLHKANANWEYVFEVDSPSLLAYWQGLGYVDEGIITFIAKSSRNPSYGIDWPRTDAPPARGDLLVGAIYHPGYDHNETRPATADLNDWRAINRPYHDGPPQFADQTQTSWVGRKPKLGWYNEGSSKVLDWEVKWALEHGVQFFMVNWFREKCPYPSYSPNFQYLSECPTGGGALGSQIREIMSTPLQALLNSQFKDTFQFAISWENSGEAGLSNDWSHPCKTVHAPTCTTTAQDVLLNSYYPYWRDHFFNKPQYLRIGGKPVVYVFRWHDGSLTVPKLLEDFRDDPNVAGDKVAMKQALDALRAKAAADTVVKMNGLIFVCGADNIQQAADLQAMKDAGCDATYNYYVWIGPGNQTSVQAYNQIAAFNQSLVTNKSILPGHLTVSVGWGSEPATLPPFNGGPTNTHWWLDPLLAGAGNSYDDAIQSVSGQLATGPIVGNRRLVMLDAWDEWVEGHYIAPSEKYGFQYLDKVRKFLSSAGTESIHERYPTCADRDTLQTSWCGDYPTECPYACTDGNGDGMCTPSTP